MKYLPQLIVWLISFSSCLSLSGQDATMQWVAGTGSSPFEQVRAVAVNDSGQVYLTGEFYGNVDFDPGPGVYYLTSAGNTDIFVQKLDSNGAFLWAYRLGGAGNDTPADLHLDSAGRVYLLGHFQGSADLAPGPGSMTFDEAQGSMFAQCVSPEGQLQWVRQWGGAISEQAIAMSVAPSGSMAIIGYFRGAADFDPGVNSAVLASSNDDLFLLRLDQAGLFSWVRMLGGASDDLGIDVEISSTGELYVLGEFGQSFDADPGAGSFVLDAGQGRDLCVVKLDSQGDFVWAYALGNDQSIDGTGVALHHDSLLYCAGRFRGVMDADPGLDTLWLDAGGQYAFFCQQVDQAGSLRWAQAWGASADAEMRAMVLDSLGQPFFTGTFSDSLDMAPGPGEYWLSSTMGTFTPSADVFLQQLDTAGQFLWAKPSGGQGFDLGMALAMGQDGILYQAGGFNATAQFDPYGNNLSLTSGGNLDVFVGQWRLNGNQPVYPGDCNHDGIADFLDLLPLGLLFGDTGPLRPSASLSWLPQTVNQWGTLYPATNIDAKHVDGDGNGQITFADTLAVFENYGRTHGGYLSDSSLLPSLAGEAPVKLLGPQSISPGDTVELMLHVGTQDSVATQAYGLAVELSYDTSLIEVIGTRWDGSWLGQKNVDLITLAKVDSLRGRWQIAITRTDQVSRNGYGRVGSIIVVISDDIAKQILPLTFQFLRVEAIDHLGHPQPLSVSPAPFDLAIDTTATALRSPEPSSLHWYHDRVQQAVVIQADRPLEGWLELYDAQGRRIRQEKISGGGPWRTSLGQLPLGAYLLRIRTTNLAYGQSFWIVHRSP
jgi:hypothetical protein